MSDTWALISYASSSLSFFLSEEEKKKPELPTINYSQIQVHLYTNTMTLSRKCQSSPDVAVYLDNGRIMEKQYIK